MHPSRRKNQWETITLGYVLLLTVVAIEEERSLPTGVGQRF
jgi:hypothetical protein